MFREAHAAVVSTAATVSSFALTDVLQTIALIVAIASGLLAIWKHFKRG